MRFIVSGYPRSKTAWLSVLLSHGDCFCYHELSATDPDLTALDSKQYEHIGTSDSGALLVAPDIDAQYVFIQRDGNAVARSLNKAVYGCDPRRLMDAIDKRKRGKVYQFNDLDKYATCNDLWHYIGNTTNLPRQWFALVQKMNIQVQDIHVPVSEESLRRLQAAI